MHVPAKDLMKCVVDALDELITEVSENEDLTDDYNIGLLNRIDDLKSEADDIYIRM